MQFGRFPRVAWRGLQLLGLFLLAGSNGCQPTTEEKPSPTLPSLPTQDVVLYEVFVPRASAAGTFDGLIPRLDSLRALGVNTLWLMPVHPTGASGSPYCVRDYQAINPEMGTLASFDRLVAAAHARGLRVLLDWVANHTAWNHAWLQQHPEWYTHDAAGRVVSPLPQWADVADLNYNQPELRQEMIRQMRFWVEQHRVDGFRCDAADMVPSDFWQQALEQLRVSNPALLWLAEGEQLTHYGAGFQLIFGWQFYAQLKAVFGQGASAATLTVAHEQELQDVPAGRFRLRFTTNHDEASWDKPPAALFGGADGAAAAYVATLAYGAVPLLYNGQEAGDPVRLGEPKRPINWTADPGTTRFFRQLLRAYQASPALRAGSLRSFSLSPDAVAVERTTASERVAVVVNVRNYPLQVSLPTAWRGGRNLLTRQPFAPGPTLSLPAYGYAVWQQQ